MLIKPAAQKSESNRRSWPPTDDASIVAASQTNFFSLHPQTFASKCVVAVRHTPNMDVDPAVVSVGVIGQNVFEVPHVDATFVDPKNRVILVKMTCPAVSRWQINIG